MTVPTSGARVGTLPVRTASRAVVQRGTSSSRCSADNGRDTTESGLPNPPRTRGAADREVASSPGRSRFRAAGAATLRFACGSLFAMGFLTAPGPANERTSARENRVGGREGTVTGPHACVGVPRDDGRPAPHVSAVASAGPEFGRRRGGRGAVGQ